jgi:hypothetical protein
LEFLRAWTSAWNDFIFGVSYYESMKLMRIFLALILWCLLLVVCWPLALLAVILFPLFWLAILPFRLLAIVVGAAFALIKAILFLPARLLDSHS